MKRKLMAAALSGTMVLGLTAGTASGDVGTFNITAESGSNVVINNYYGDQAAPEGSAEAPAEEAGNTAGEVKSLSFSAPGTYTGTSEAGKNGTVSVTATFSEDRIESIETEHMEDAEIGGIAIDTLTKLITMNQTLDVDSISGATVSSDAFLEALKDAAGQAGMTEGAASGAGAAAAEAAPLSFTPGTYTGTGMGYNGPLELNVTFTEDAIESIEVASSKETAHVGTVAYDIMFEDAIAANGAGVDSVSGATFTSAAVKAALNDAAEQAGVSDPMAFMLNTVKHEAGEKITGEYDVIIVGAGGAGISAAAQAAQNGDKVLIIEKNAEIGGNTLVSGGQYQSVMPYLVWDENDPDATEGVYEHNGQSYPKVVNGAKGNLDVLRTILEWNEEPFDENYFTDENPYVAGEIDEISKAGVHEEYLPILQTLKKQIQAYLDWADAKIADGTKEEDLTLFSTLELHEFQTYYGGLRQNADKTEWIYGNVDLVKQVVEGGQGLKEWLEDQGAVFDEASQLTLIGALWQRENKQLGADMDGDGEIDEPGAGAILNWGAYFVPCRQTVLDNGGEIMLRTTAEKLLLDDSGRVVGVSGTQYDGTEVEVTATKGVILATGGYAANIEKVRETNVYWDPEFITDRTETTNRSSLQGDGITMGEEAGAATTGTGWTQMMPISWVDDGDLAFGSGFPCIYVNPTTGKRFVNESAERDVLSLGEFENGVEVNGTQGVFLEIANEEVTWVPYPYMNPDGTFSDEDVEMRQYVRTIDELQDLFDELGWVETDAETVRATIEEYDMAYMTNTLHELEVPKLQASHLIGYAEQKEDGTYDTDTYTLDGVRLRIRVMAPSTHHTMGGLCVDTERHVLAADGSIIPGLYAAGEVSGGIHGGNRLGGNAIVEIYVSGRTAANAADADAE